MEKKIYIVEICRELGLSKQYQIIGNWKMVKLWATDGSLEGGDKVFELKETKQPKIKPIKPTPHKHCKDFKKHENKGVQWTIK